MFYHFSVNATRTFHRLCYRFIAVLIMLALSGCQSQASPDAVPPIPTIEFGSSVPIASITLTPYAGMRVAPPSAYPDPNKTPGARNAAVTQETIGTTICVSGWTATVRSVNDQEKKEVMQRYEYTGPSSAVEIDHFLSLEDGGSNSLDNLWPELYVNGKYGARVKDRLETKIKEEVCANRLSLIDGQNMLTQDWVAGYEKYFGSLST